MFCFSADLRKLFVLVMSLPWVSSCSGRGASIANDPRMGADNEATRLSSVSIQSDAEYYERGISKYDEKSFARLVDFRVGSGEEKFFYTFGDVRAHPGGKVLYHYEGIELCKLDPDSRTFNTARQLSRRIFFYKDAITGKYLRNFNGKVVEPTAYPYLIMNWQLDAEGTVVVQGTQGTVPRVLTMEMRMPTLRKLGNGSLHFPINAFFQSGAYSFHEVGTYISLPQDSSLSRYYSGTFTRLQNSPSWMVDEHEVSQVMLDLSVENLSDFHDLPEDLKEIISKDYPLYTKPPRDLDECEEIQKGEK